MRRRSRTTAAQARALAQLDKYLLTPGYIDISFGRDAPMMVEIGFGNGAALAQFALDHPTWNCIGVDVFRPGIGALINRCQDLNLTNVRIVDREGLTFIESLPASAVDLMWVLFPDPWPKSRHHKRRLVTREFGETVVQKLKPEGELIIATDWQPYAHAIETSLNGIDLLMGGPVLTEPARMATKYEARGLDLGHRVTHFEYRKQPFKRVAQ